MVDESGVETSDPHRGGLAATSQNGQDFCDGTGCTARLASFAGDSVWQISARDIRESSTPDL
jgi:hypothetical protein